MAYQRINFKNQSVERPRTYEMSHNADGSVTLVDSFGLVDELGTPINADTMGHIEDGIEAAAIRHYNSTETYNEKEWVLGSVDNTQTIFKSLISSNIGNSLTNQKAWEEVKLGGNGGSMPIGTVFPLSCSSNYVPEGCLLCDGSEYAKAQFEQLWENYLSSNLLNTCSYEEYEADLLTYDQCGKFAVKPLEYDGSSLIIQGTPTITSDGLASGFGTSDNITANLNIIEANELKVTTKFNYVNSTSSQVLYWLNSCGVRLTQESNGAIAVYSQSGTMFYQAKSSFGSPTEGDEVYAELLVTPTNAELKLTINNETYTFAKTDFTLTLTSTLVGIGSSYYQGNTPFSSVIDLKHFSISVDNVKVLASGVGDTFKVPTIKDGAVIQQAMSDGELGKAYNEGLPNITASLGGIFDAEGALARTSTRSSGSGDYNTQNANFDASRSSDVYGKTDETSLNKVQINAVALRYFVVVANGILEDSQIDWNEWASSLQVKANKSDVDGQWVASKLILSTSVSAGTYTLDLSDYLPKDGYNYEVKLFGECYKEGTTATNVYVYTTIDNLTKNEIMATANQRRGRFYSIYTIDTSRTITMTIDTVCASLEVLAVAYRRVGRNI